jgi:Arc/MetJ family transcription regulator
MSNLTLAIDDDLLAEARRYAQIHETTVNALVRQLLEQTVRAERAQWAEDFRRFAESVRVTRTTPVTWTKEEINERPWSKRLRRGKPRR